MSIGMTWEQFWHGDYDIYAIFRDAENYRKEQRNYDMWLQGLYINRAVSVSLSQAFSKSKNGALKYLDYPIAITAREKQAEKQRNIERTRRWFMSEGKDGNSTV